MRRGSPSASLTGSPVVIGAITTLIVLVAVFLSYNANNGLPFVPSYRVDVLVPDAARTLQNNEVRIGGRRVGVVESITPATGPGGEVVARLGLKLDKAAGPLPQDSAFRVRYRSAFGLKFLEVTRGDGPPAVEGFTFDGTDDGAVASIDGSSPGASNGVFVEQTEFDDIYNAFDAPTRRAVRTNLVGFGDALSGRGASLNEAIAAAGPLMRDLEPVARRLAAPETGLARFIAELGDYTRIVDPVAGEQAEAIANAGTTLGALARDPGALQAAISGGVPALETAVEALPGQRGLLADTRELFAALRPGVADLDAALPAFNAAMRSGTPVLERSASLSAELQGVLAELERLAGQPTTSLSLSRIRDVLRDAAPTIRFAAPVQTVCNLWTYFWTLVPNAVSDRDQVGFSLRNNLIHFPLGAQGIGTPFPAPFDRITVPGQVDTGLQGYSGLIADGKHGGASPDAGLFDPYSLPILYGNPYGPTGQQHADCQPGQTGYALGAHPVTGQPASSPAMLNSDLPGSRGPTTVFWNQDGSRELRDTRVEGRQP